MKTLLNGLKIDSEGTKRWYKESWLHREDGPALESEGVNIWYLEGTVHREDGPAMEFKSGTKVWYKKGMRHRVDGPACESSNGEKEWYFKDRLLKDFWELWEKLSDEERCNPNLLKRLP